jgi:DNA-binding HxlR family transcriptional regulator
MRADIPHCAATTTLQVIGGRWKIILIASMIDQPQRFSELQRAVPHATRKMLTEQLRELEADGIVHREVYPQMPPKVEYSLTPLGQTLRPVIEAIVLWGRQHDKEVGSHNRTAPESAALSQASASCALPLH